MSLLWISPGYLHWLGPVFTCSPCSYHFTISLFLCTWYIHYCTVTHTVSKYGGKIDTFNATETLPLFHPLYLNSNCISTACRVFEATQALGASSMITHFATGIPGFWQRARKEMQFLNSSTKVNTFTCENLPLTPVKPVAPQASIMCLSLAVQILWHSLAP